MGRKRRTLGVLQIKAVGFFPKCLNNHSNFTLWGLVPGKKKTTNNNNKKPFFALHKLNCIKIKLMSIESVMLSKSPSLPTSSPALHLSHHQGLFQWDWLFASGGPSTGASTSASVLPMNIQGWLPLGLTGLISLQFKGVSRVFSSIFPLVVELMHSRGCMTYIDFLISVV